MASKDIFVVSKCRNSFVSVPYYLVNITSVGVIYPSSDIKELAKKIYRYIEKSLYGQDYKNEKNLSFEPQIKNLAESNEVIRFVNNPANPKGKQILVRITKLTDLEMDQLWLQLLTLIPKNHAQIIQQSLIDNRDHMEGP